MNNKKIESKNNRKRGLLKVLLRLLTLVIILAVILFVAAGSWEWIMGWIYMAMYAGAAIFATLIIPYDPELIEERTKVKAGVKEWDKGITIVGSILYPLGIFVIAGLDMRFNWSPKIAIALQITALVIAVAGNLLSTWATAVNKFYSRFVRIQKERGHSVISEGPYRFVRHPGYLGQIIFSLATALALDSLWALIPSGLFTILLVVRTVLEDKVLLNELAGYKAYAQKVHSRLFPFIW